MVTLWWGDDAGGQGLRRGDLSGPESATTTDAAPSPEPLKHRATTDSSAQKTACTDLYRTQLLAKLPNSEAPTASLNGGRLGGSSLLC